MAHVKLNLVWGLPIAPLDPFSAEKGVEAINLLDNAGFQLESPNGWIPQIAPVKNGGMFSDSPIADGATLISGVRANVTETMTLIVASATLETRQAAMTTLNRYAQLCEDFWENDTQIDPVYLEWQAPGSPGSQYALIYTMEVAESDDPFSEPYTAGASRIVITLTREPFWRALPPGQNPKWWTMYRLGLIPGVQWNYQDLDLDQRTFVTAEASLVQELVQNHQTFLPFTIPGTFGSSTTYTIGNKNFVDVPSAMIPGDAPALAHISIAYQNPSALASNRALIWVNSNPTTQLSSFTNTPMYQHALVSCSRCDPNTATGDTTYSADTGATQGQRMTVTFATVTASARRISFGWTVPGAGGANFEPFTVNLMKGMYAVFVRARQVGGTANTISMFLRSFTNATAVDTNTVFAQISGIAGNTAGWVLHYLGMLNIPSSGNPDIRIAGDGMNDVPQLGFDFFAARSAGAGQLYVNDFVFVKTSEASIDLQTSFVNGGSFFAYDSISDTTGYWSHGQRDTGLFTVNITNLLIADARGRFITLQPKTNNRIYVLALDAGLSRVTDNFTVRVDLVPRYSGVRDT